MTTLAQNPPATHSRTIRLGVVGTRNIGKNHIRNATITEGAEVVAVADTDSARLGAVGDEFKIPHRFQDAQRLFACDEVDAVVLAVPNHLHAPLAIDALKAGKHVLVEKPIARTVAEADEMIAARDASGKVLMVGMHQRLSPPAVALKAAMDAGRIGKPWSVLVNWHEARPKPSFWERGDWSLTKEASGGGPLLDLGIHRLDLALHFLGFPKVKYACGQCFYGIGRQEALALGRRYEVEDSGVGFLQFENGSTLVIEASYFHNTATPGNSLRIAGDVGCVAFPAEQPIQIYEAGELRPIPFTPDSSAPGSCARHFVRVLQGQETLIPNPEQAREGLRIIEAIYRSAELGQPVAL